MNPDVRDEIVGNVIFSLLLPIYGELTGKITGMLLDKRTYIDQKKLLKND